MVNQNPFRPFQIANVLNRLAMHHMKTTLNAGDTLSPASFLQSNAGQKTGSVWVPRYQLVMQRDGDLSLYDRGQLRWSSHTASRGGAYAVMQLDGNFVVFDCNHVPLWTTGTNVPGSHLILEDTGHLVVYSPTRKRMWTNEGQKVEKPAMNIFEAAAGMDGLQPTYSDPVTGEIRQELYGASDVGFCGEYLATDARMAPGQSISSSAGNYTCSFQTDGNLVVYDRSGNVQWASGTNGKGATSCVMQGDGNLVIYAGSNPLWDSGTRGGGLSLQMQNDGNLVIYDGGHSAKWASNDHKGGNFLGMHIDIINAVKSLIPANGQAAANQAINALSKGVSVNQVLQAASQLPAAQKVGATAIAAVAAAHRAGAGVSFGPNMSALGKAGGLMFSGLAVIPPIHASPAVKASVATVAVSHPEARAGAAVAATAIAAKKSWWTRIKGWFGFKSA